MPSHSFSFKQFTIQQDHCAMKVGTDGVLLGAWAKGGQRILDIGTGTGLIALMMAQRFPEAHVDGIEIVAEAAAQANENASHSPFAERVSIFNVSLQQYHADAYDAIVANPPYFPHALKSQNKARATARQTDSLSFRDLSKHSARLLTAEGTLSIILPTDQTPEMESEAAFAGLCLNRRIMVSTSEKKPPKRCLLAFGKRNSPCFSEEKECIVINGQPSAWYEDLVSSFYL